MYDKIQYISQGNSITEQLNNIQQVLDAGCTWLQLRYKKGTEAEMRKLAIATKKLIENYNCTFIINDYPELVEATGADGVHLGLTDTPIEQARKIVGRDKIIGGTANTLEDVLQRHREQCNYVGLGPFRFTQTKEKLSPVLGLSGYSTIMTQLQEMEINIPVFAIGGIQQEDIQPILNTGIYGVALSGYITQHENKKQLLNQLYTLCSH
ncbi:thiamine-phosphate synthase [Flavobacterium beibuense F44-8]|uniref:Thiamine-phosphate synthase n=1 Tax=Flavobacterium beibuense F44-8 TaxID=1406840 RepID=A0A0A2LVU5_9FLAO|nr:thiamine phosphate synthase [Flavobacterium beibuense]KGO80260.1 thiamine-phosphate synthase [Flavobacterium beibuense F44-8]